MGPRDPASEDAARILVVDDEPDILYLVSSFVRDAFPEAQVLTARTATEGFTVLESGPVHAIVSDYRMPSMDGIEFLGHAGRRFPASRRILMTAFTDLDLGARALHSGVDAFIEKSGDPQDLVTALDAALARSPPA
ncbi:MAG TPA: response regulator [Candidatus Thermoplasmatota archaeon]|nr:response regulator [Candidatus Thermoplasmatota archaeon]